ncbi:terminase small subunit [Sulfitobacter sp. R18_1]|uniref:terminase small subunit n=1 Tax=Sulfitobacter sp. R18_1 TaxID=2821104 RepID=UPI001ADD40AD|nr:terminase small subunit [Sulfitobacter sp. R18_1]MBO9430611.1 terminase small subunit [Sulfitobacter sp. R18_1]
MAPKTPPKKTPKKRELDNRELRFVDEYLVDLDTERAAIAAGYSKSVAKSKAYQWVSNGKVKPHVYDAIRAGFARLSEKKGVTQERVVAELAKVGFATMRQFMRVDDEGQPQINMDDTDDDNLDALAEIQTETVLERDGSDSEGKAKFTHVRKTKIKLHDKLNALDKLARYTGVYEKEAEHAAGAFADAITEIQQRMSKAPIRRDKPEDGK